MLLDCTDLLHQNRDDVNLGVYLLIRLESKGVPFYTKHLHGFYPFFFACLLILCSFAVLL